MAWKIILPDSTGSEYYYGGDDIKKIMKLFSGYDLTLENTSDAVLINTPTTFYSDKFMIRSPTTNRKYIFQAQDIDADRIIKLPLMTADGEIALAAIGGQNDWGTNMQIFRHQYLKLMNPLNTYGYLINTSAITNNINLTIGQLSADDTFTFNNASQVLNNKTLVSPTITAMTINTDSNTIKHSTTNNAGDLLVNTGTKFDRLARGNANQLPIVNPTGTGLTWIDAASLVTGGAIPAYTGGGENPTTVNNTVSGQWYGTSAVGATGIWNGFLTNLSGVTPTNVTDTSGRIGMRWALTGDNVIAGFRTNDEYFTLQNDPELTVRYKYIANSQDIEYRINIGFINDVTRDFSNGMGLLANYSAVMWYKDEALADTTVKLARNDGDALQDDDSSVSVAATDENIHTIRIFGDSTNSRFGVSLDGANATYYTTEIPASTTRLGCVVQFMNDDVNTRYFEMYGAYFKAKVL